MTGVNPFILVVIVLIAILLFIIGFLHYLLVRCSITRRQPSSSSPSSPPPAFQRQLQHLFRMHDSGLDQSTIDALPVFFYRQITTNDAAAFDCAVCLREFSQGDRLKLIPSCTHAFHIHCIDTWLLSNSTCPLCRTLIASPNEPATVVDQNAAGPSQIVSVRLGKFRTTNEDNSNIDGRRCFSMGTFQYIMVDTNLQVPLSNRIHPRSRDDSFSLSKIWLWSNKDGLPTPSDCTAILTPNIH